MELNVQNTDMPDILVLLPVVNATAEIIQPESNALWNLSLPASLINLNDYSGFVFQCIQMNLIQKETVERKEQLKPMQIGYLKEKENKTGTIMFDPDFHQSRK
jgi:hypothetical protein